MATNRSSDGEFAKGMTKIENSGRKKGVQNKKTVAARQALHEAFEGLGGVKSLIEFGKDQPAEFYRLWVKTMPREINADITSGGETFGTITSEDAVRMVNEIKHKMPPDL